MFQCFIFFYNVMLMLLCI